MPPFPDKTAFLTALRDVPSADGAARAAATARNAQLTKPEGALGRLETLAVWYKGWRPHTRADCPQVLVFAGHHGINRHTVSAYPADVTGQMIGNFNAGGAAISQLAALLGTAVEVQVPMGDQPTADFALAPAMDEATLCHCLSVGWQAVDQRADLLIVGEMGIGNTTAATALAARLLGGSASDWVGRGTGIDAEGLARKTAVVDAGLCRHAATDSPAPLDALASLGGHEIAAMTGAMAAARHYGCPVMLDGFIAGSAAVVLHALDPTLIEHVVAGHRSAEAAHGKMLDALGLEPLLSLDMRLGEGSGAAVATHILRAALACHDGMATFAEAGVSDR